MPSQTVENGEKATMPVPNPTKEGYTFDYWADTEETDTVFNFNTPITQDTTIYACWGQDEDD